MLQIKYTNVNVYILPVIVSMCSHILQNVYTLAQSSKRSPLNHHVFVLLTRAFGSSLISHETSWNGFLYDISQYNMSKHEIKLAKND